LSRLKYRTNVQKISGVSNTPERALFRFSEKMDAKGRLRSIGMRRHCRPRFPQVQTAPATAGNGMERIGQELPAATVVTGCGARCTEAKRAE
jgi:hypothetical protein